MNGRKRPSPALVIAVLALFVSLSGTAVAAGVVPLAKRALSADKAKQADNEPRSWAVTRRRQSSRRLRRRLVPPARQPASSQSSRRPTR